MRGRSVWWSVSVGLVGILAACGPTVQDPDDTSSSTSQTSVSSSESGRETTSSTSLDGSTTQLPPDPDPGCEEASCDGPTPCEDQCDCPEDHACRLGCCQPLSVEA